MAELEATSGAGGAPAAPRHHQRPLTPATPDGRCAVPVAIISDPGEDLDDEMATLLLRCLVDEGTLDPRCVVCNLAPAAARARLMRGTLDMLGLEDVPVGVGSAGGSASHRDTFSHLAAGYIAGADAAVEDGQALLARVFGAARDGSLTLLCISALTDAREFLARNEDLFLRKIREVVIMGGVAPSAAGLVPDTAANNAFDEAASAALYAALQDLRVPMVVVTREAAYACPVPRRVYDDIAATGSPIGVRLQAAQRTSITALWRRTHASGAERLGLPARCGPAWFLDTFCGGAGSGRGAQDEVWDLVRSFNMYDAVALIAASPRLRREHFDPTVVAVGGVDHAVIGLSRDESGVRDVDGLRAFLTDGFLRGIRSPLCSPKPRPRKPTAS